MLFETSRNFTIVIDRHETKTKIFLYSNAENVNISGKALKIVVFIG